MAKVSRERAEEYAVAYQYALEHTRAGRRHKGRAVAKVARGKGVSRQYVADVLVVPRKLGIPTTREALHAHAPVMGTDKPRYRWQGIRVLLGDMLNALSNSAYMGRVTP